MGGIMPAIALFVFPALLLIVIAAAVLIVRGLLGVQLFTEPRCMKCGYDLRKTRFEDEGSRGCPECGADLNQPKAVKFGKRQRKPKLIVAGLAVGVLPIVLLMFVSTTRVMSGGANRSHLSNAALIANLAMNANQPWDWQELQRRLTANRLSNAEVDQAIAQLTVYLNQQRAAGQRQGPLHWSDQFIRLALARQAVSPTQFEQLCRAHYDGRISLANVTVAARQGKPILLEPRIDSSWDLDNCQLVFAIREALIDGTPASIVDRHQPAKALHADELSGKSHDYFHNLALDAALDPGEHELKVVVDVGVLPRNAPLVGMSGKPGQKARWQNPLATWSTDLTAKFRMTPADQSPITLETDPMLNPAGVGGLRVARAYAVPMPKGARVMVRITGRDSAPGAFCFRYKVRIDGKEHSSRQAFGKAANWGMNSGEGAIDLREPLPPEVTKIDVILEPDLETAERYPQLHTIWGKPVEFPDVPLERHDLAGP